MKITLEEHTNRRIKELKGYKKQFGNCQERQGAIEQLEYLLETWIYRKKDK